MATFQTDLRKVLTVISMPRMKRGGGSGAVNGSDKDERKQWEEAVEAVIRDITAGVPTPERSNKSIVQIVIYESSV